MTLLVEVRDGIGFITLNRPDAYNALVPEMQFAFIEALQRFATDPAVGAIVVTGAGKAFCAGGDVKAMATPPTEPLPEQIADLRARQQIVALIQAAPQVVIGAINGVATGAGLAIALACDLRIAARSARFGAAYAKVGLTGDFGISYLLTREIGAARARHMLLTAELLDAEAGLAAGIVSALVDDAALLDHCLALAQSFASGPRLAYAEMKRNLAFAQTATLAEVLDREAEKLVLAKQTADHKEAARAFVEKRKPLFAGK